MRRFASIIAALLLAAGCLLAFAGPVSAQSDECYPTCVDDDVLGEDVENTPHGRPEVEGTDVARSDGLPVTGGDVIGLTVVGLGAIAVGFGFVKFSRRTRTSAAA